MRRREMPHAHVDMPNLAPMVDVVMCILIFFMLGTSFALSEGALPMQLPSQVGPGGASVVSVVPVVRIALRVDPQNAAGCRILVMEKQLPAHTFAALRAFMDEKRDAGADPTGRVVISTEPSVEYQNVVSTMDACVRAGFSNIQFALNSGPTPADAPEEP